ncbi:radical SAM family heme chaperone HemW [Rhodoferax sp. U11-2br]|uniref:radical SAM family heme chaperone HemW n=1 Tax=Rhodoferax sp. U11-2br TaxID=2838878 RepID=UPI001BE86832|nr:radical SAM family heme chaperone HemW [Rhodoferax sp. U11-2br]MBT3067846.1 oxygen-independent coproporphyrinogen III oxidase-like protein [Rhodoferax sp. U11-2br]
MIPIQPEPSLPEEAVQPHDIQHYMRPGTLQLSSLPPLSLYVHLPWCLKKCPYCDFNSHEQRAADLPEQDYLNALMADLESALPLIWGRSVQTVFIGGGTPSLFSPQAIDQLIAGIRARVKLAADAEITLEANPGTFEKDRFKAFRAAGVTRLSVGVQSFNDGYLSILGRVHNRSQALAALEEAALNFETFNLDLMYALPGQTLDDLRSDVATALSFAPPHLSIYHLTIEPNTFFAKHPPAPVDDDLAADMLDLITELTGPAGLQRYEVSAYAKPGHRCAHNLNYWQFGDYLGIGAGAHSKLSFAHRVLRQVRLRDPARYMVQALAGSAIAQENEVKRSELPFEFMLNALRLADGFALPMFAERTGLSINAITAALQEAQARGLMDSDLAHARPTSRGFDFLNDLQALFLPKT